MVLLTKSHKVPWSPNSCVFSNRLDSLRLSHCRILEGNEFLRRGAAFVKHGSSKVLCGRRTAHIAQSAHADVSDESIYSVVYSRC